MNYGARPMRSTRRLSNSLGQRAAWYRIANSVAGVPTQVSIYDEIGFFGVAAGEFMADLKGINGDIELHINSPGGDVHDGIAIYNQLKQRTGSIAVVIDGLAASAASFIAQAASPGRLQVAPHAQMMVHNGFSMAIGDANDLRKTADLLDMITTEIASIYAERSGKPVDFWLAQMAAETWYTDQKAVDTGLADSILGQDAPAKADWDLSVYNAGAPKNCPACGKYNASGAEKCSTCGKPMTGDATGPEPGDGAPQDKGGTGARNADGPADLGDGWVCDPDGQVRYDPDGDGDDDSQASSDTDHDYWDADGNSIKAVPPKPRTDVQEPVPTKPGASDRSLFPVLNADVDSSEWDAGKAWKAGAASDDPAAFYTGICAGRKAGDPSVQSSWALPYKYSPSSAPNAAGVRNALARIDQTEGLTNKPEAQALLERLMKSINPDYEPSGKAISPAVVASAFILPQATVDESAWDATAALALAAASTDPAAYYRGICAGRRTGDPSTPQAWALPFKYAPDSPPNASGVRAALAELPCLILANPAEARGVLDKAMRVINPAREPDDEIDPELLAAAFAIGLTGAGK